MSPADSDSGRSPSDYEKRFGASHFEAAAHEGLPPDPDAHLSEAERAALLCFLYLCSFLDRTNIGNAKIDGLQTDLKMTNGQYNASLTIFFVSYACFEPLTNVLLKRLRPSIFLPAIMSAWGIVMRFFLGLTEAGLFPGVNYYLSCWYKRSEFGIRAAIFFSAAAVAGSFGGLLAAAIAKMRGIGGRP
ncbi:hypothetical protein LTR04_004025, partial [Oleoguttula sp. CCFEE 6159]